MIEEAFHLLRLCSIWELATYYVGALPFVLALLFFVADMSQSAFAQSRLLGGSLLLAAGLVWMRCWQSIFCGQLLAVRMGHGGADVPADAQARTHWTLRRVLCMVAVHGAIAPWAMILTGAAAILIVPLPWVLAFFQSVLCIGAPRRTAAVAADEHAGQPAGTHQPGLRETLRESWRQAGLWPEPNVSALIVACLLGVVLIANVAILLFLLPTLLKILLGVDTAFSRSATAVLNTTFLSVTVAIGYLLLDPMIKALYVLRCFYGASIRTGEDLRADVLVMGRQQRQKPRFIAGIAGILILALTSTAFADAPSAEVQPPSADNLDKAIQQVIEQPEYSWRMPRETLEDQAVQEGSGFIRDIGKTIEGWFDSIGEWLNPKGGSSSPRSSGGGSSVKPPDVSLPKGEGVFLGAMKALMWVLIFLVIAALVVMLAKVYINRSKQEDEEEDDSASVAKVDLTQEDATADQLPEDGWLGMAADLIARGELRLAMRAMYLACLAHLAQRELIRIARFKSNCDYRLELQRRSHAVPDLIDPFTANMTMFEHAWYGMHEVTMQRINTFKDNQRRMVSALGVARDTNNGIHGLHGLTDYAENSEQRAAGA